MITRSQFPALQGPNALPALGKGKPMKPNKGTHPLAGKGNANAHPLARPPRAPQPPRSAQPPAPASADDALKALKTPAQIGRFAAMDANTQLRKPK